MVHMIYNSLGFVSDSIGGWDALRVPLECPRVPFEYPLSILIWSAVGVPTYVRPAGCAAIAPIG
jgi:hypothetical protein